MQSCLENLSMQERTVELSRTHYVKGTNEYSASHPDALSTGDAQGKGTGHAGHSHWLPNCSGTIGMINYSNFDTDISSNPGNNVDNQQRQIALGRMLYTYNNAYGVNLVTTDLDPDFESTAASMVSGHQVGG